MKLRLLVNILNKNTIKHKVHCSYIVQNNLGVLIVYCDLLNRENDNEHFKRLSTHQILLWHRKKNNFSSKTASKIDTCLRFKLAVNTMFVKMVFKMLFYPKYMKIVEELQLHKKQSPISYKNMANLLL